MRDQPIMLHSFRFHSFSSYCVVSSFHQRSGAFIPLLRNYSASSPFHLSSRFESKIISIPTLFSNLGPPTGTLTQPSAQNVRRPHGNRSHHHDPNRIRHAYRNPYPRLRCQVRSLPQQAAQLRRAPVRSSPLHHLSSRWLERRRPGLPRYYIKFHPPFPSINAKRLQGSPPRG